VLERLADLPRATELLRLALQVATGHVQAHAVTEDMAERAGDGDVLPALRQDGDHLDLVMDVRGFRGIGEVPAAQEVARVLLEEERRLLLGRAHFHRVGLVVATDAVDAVHGQRSADPRTGRLGARRAGRRNLQWKPWDLSIGNGGCYFFMPATILP